jgi:hypothetical protein
MTFLAPIAALVAGAIALPALLALYLLKLRRRPVRVSTTLFWTQAVEDLEANVPLRWLRASWLLALHVLILTLLVIALGRPALSSGGASGGRVIIVIDRSASMNTRDGTNGATRLDDAKARAIDAVKAAAGSGSSFVVVTFAVEPALVQGQTNVARAAIDAIRAITPTDQPGDLDAALRLVDGLATRTGEETDAAPEQNEPVLAMLFSDGVFNTQAESSAARVQFVRVGNDATGAAGRDNLGIVAFAIARDENDPLAVRVFLRVLNAGDAPRRAVVSLSLSGQGAVRTTLDVPARGAATASLSVRAPGGGVLVASLPENDALSSDDAAGVVIPAPDRRRVLLVRPPATIGTGPEPLSELVLPATLAEVPDTLIVQVRAADFEQMTRDGRAAEFDMIVFDRVRPASMPPVSSLSLGSGLPAPGLDERPRDAKIEPTFDFRPGYVLSWKRTHPLLRDVSLEAVYVSGFVRLSPAGRDDPQVEELARGVNGPLIVESVRGTRRHVVVAFDLRASNWPLLVSFPVFLATAVDALTATSRGGVGASTAEPMFVDAPGTRSITLRRIGGEEPPREIRVVATDSGRIPLGRLERAGIYEWRGTGDTRGFIGASLLDETESRIETAASLGLGGRVVRAGEGDGTPREIWHWFVLAAFALLCVEWALFTRRASV